MSEPLEEVFVEPFQELDELALKYREKNLEVVIGPMVEPLLQLIDPSVEPLYELDPSIDPLLMLDPSAEPLSELDTSIEALWTCQ